jgi:hypothetical protein
MYQIAARHYAFEGRCFVVSVGSIMRKQDLPRELEVISSVAQSNSEFLLGGGSAIIGPDGNYVAGPSFDAEVIILARINLERNREESLLLDVTGHYNRPDLFEFDYKAHSLNGKGHLHELPPASAAEALPPPAATNGAGMFLHDPPSQSVMTPMVIPEPATSRKPT